jgi:hypothetical protein
MLRTDAAMLATLRSELPTMDPADLGLLAGFDAPAYLAVAGRERADYFRAVADLARAEIERRASEAQRAHLRVLP